VLIPSDNFKEVEKLPSVAIVTFSLLIFKTESKSVLPKISIKSSSTTSFVWGLSISRAGEERVSLY